MDPRPKRLLDKFAMPCGSSTTRFAKKRMWIGSSATSCFTRNGIAARWVRQMRRSRLFISTMPSETHRDLRCSCMRRPQIVGRRGLKASG